LKCTPISQQSIDNISHRCALFELQHCFHRFSRQVPVLVYLHYAK